MVELGNADFTQAGVIVGEQGATVELPGSGFGGGISDSGGSALGGVVRNGELVGGIHHALSMAVIMMGLSGNTGGKDPWVWPATSAPFYAKKYFPKRGNVPIGALLAIPPTVKIENLGVGGPGTPGWELARAMQDYGVYVTNACKIQQYHFYFEGGNLPANLSDILLRLSRQLHVVKNNSPATPGGGGKPRRDPTPPSAK